MADGEAGGAAVNEEGGDPLLRAFRRIVLASGDKDDDEIGMIGARDEMLGAIHHPIATLAAGRAFHAPHVRTGPRLGHRQRVHPLAAHGGKEIALDLLARTGHQDVLRTAKEMRQRHRATAKLTLD